MEWYEIVGIVIVLGWLWMAWEMWNAPLMPEDYDLSEEEQEVLKDLKSRPDNFEEDYDNQPFGD